METASNVFTDGLTTDRHPLTTQNNCLTDALNATFITFNGNEMVLQNDMGNTLIQDTATGNVMGLSQGFVPVGMKEYGGILYIASMNPANGKGELGTIPSPKIEYLYESPNSETLGVSLAKTLSTAEESTISPDTFDERAVKDSFYQAVSKEYILVNSDQVFTCGDQFMVVLNLDDILTKTYPQYYLQTTGSGAATAVSTMKFPAITKFNGEVSNADDEDAETVWNTFYGWYNLCLYALVPGKTPIRLTAAESTPQKYYVEGVDDIQTSEYWFIPSKDLEGKTLDMDRCSQYSSDKANLYKKYPNVLNGYLAVRLEPNIPSNCSFLTNQTTEIDSPFTYGRISVNDTPVIEYNITEEGAKNAVGIIGASAAVGVIPIQVGSAYVGVKLYNYFEQNDQNFTATKTAYSSWVAIDWSEVEKAKYNSNTFFKQFQSYATKNRTITKPSSIKYQVIIPGFQYDSKGPMWIDKIEISETSGRKLYKFGDTEASKTLTFLRQFEESADSGPNKYYTNPNSQKFANDDQSGDLFSVYLIDGTYTKKDQNSTEKLQSDLDVVKQYTSISISELQEKQKQLEELGLTEKAGVIEGETSGGTMLRSRSVRKTTDTQKARLSGRPSIGKKSKNKYGARSGYFYDIINISDYKEFKDTEQFDCTLAGSQVLHHYLTVYPTYPVAETNGQELEPIIASDHNYEEHTGLCYFKDVSANTVLNIKYRLYTNLGTVAEPKYALIHEGVQKYTAVGTVYNGEVQWLSQTGSDCEMKYDINFDEIDFDVRLNDSEIITVGEYGGDLYNVTYDTVTRHYKQSSKDKINTNNYMLRAYPQGKADWTNGGSWKKGTILNNEFAVTSMWVPTVCWYWEGLGGSSTPFVHQRNYFKNLTNKIGLSAVDLKNYNISYNTETYTGNSTQPDRNSCTGNGMCGQFAQWKDYGDDRYSGVSGWNHKYTTEDFQNQFGNSITYGGCTIKKASYNSYLARNPNLSKTKYCLISHWVEQAKALGGIGTYALKSFSDSDLTINPTILTESTTFIKFSYLFDYLYKSTPAATIRDISPNAAKLFVYAGTYSSSADSQKINIQNDIYINGSKSSDSATYSFSSVNCFSLTDITNLKLSTPNSEIKIPLTKPVGTLKNVYTVSGKMKCSNAYDTVDLAGAAAATFFTAGATAGALAGRRSYAGWFFIPNTIPVWLVDDLNLSNSTDYTNLVLELTPYQLYIDESSDESSSQGYKPLNITNGTEVVCKEVGIDMQVNTEGIYEPENLLKIDVEKTIHYNQKFKTTAYIDRESDEYTKFNFYSGDAFSSKNKPFTINIKAGNFYVLHINYYNMLGDKISITLKDQVNNLIGAIANSPEDTFLIYGGANGIQNAKLAIECKGKINVIKNLGLYAITATEHVDDLQQYYSDTAVTIDEIKTDGDEDNNAKRDAIAFPSILCFSEKDKTCYNIKYDYVHLPNEPYQKAVCWYQVKDNGVQAEEKKFPGYTLSGVWGADCISSMETQIRQVKQ